MSDKLRAPFPWFGGKSRVAHLVWARFGDVPNYVEPFAGSLAVLLGRPTPPRTETVNDLDCHIANFWRATTWEPEVVACHADWPVNEADMHARHKWLVRQERFRKRLRRDPDHFDAKIAGWWVWGLSQWIGSGWCSKPEWGGRISAGRAARGIHARGADRPHWEKRPSLHRGQRGVAAAGGARATRPSREAGVRDPASQATGLIRRPHLTGRQGVQVVEQMPQISGDGSGSGRGVLTQAVSNNLSGYFMALRDRLRRVRVCCGDWRRILGPSPTTCIGVTGVFLDPPYTHELRDARCYAHEDADLSRQVRDWAVEHGHDPKLRIALCGLAGEHDLPPDWECVPWKANGGYGNQSVGRGRRNAGRERIWFSPHCLRPEREPELFGEGTTA
jgi:DNA adenine methylase